MDTILGLKIIGAILVFALGIWIGIGTPGARRPARRKEWDAVDRLRATWINRVFFRGADTSRGWDTGRFLAPKDEGEPKDEERSAPEVRLRR